LASALAIDDARSVLVLVRADADADVIRRILVRVRCRSPQSSFSVVLTFRSNFLGFFFVWVLLQVRPVVLKRFVEFYSGLHFDSHRMMICSTPMVAVFGATIA
jgi:hypothetical protein